MSLLSTPQRWGAISQLLHWLTAAAVIAQAGLGWWMVGLPMSMQKFQLYALHKSIGITLLGLVLLRLAWRMVDCRPDWLDLPRWQRRLAQAAHLGLYALLLLMPLSGWVYNSASNFPLRWFGGPELPALVGPDERLKAISGAVHEYGAWLLAALFSLHVLAALKHHLLDRDDTLRRMLPWVRPRARYGDR